MSHTLGLLRAYFLVSLCCIGSFLFAYDTGIVGGILTLSSFEADFRYTKAQATNVSSTCVSILQAGAFFGCFAAFPINNKLGRRFALRVASTVFCVGVVLQTVNSHQLGVFYAGRVISGFGVGIITVTIPIFSAEMAPTSIRGRLGAFFQLFFATGVFVSYWADYSVEYHVKPGTLQWTIPIACQLIPGGLVGLGTLLVPESARWLAKRAQEQDSEEKEQKLQERARNALIWVRGGEETDEVKEEFGEIQDAIRAEIRASEGMTWKELLLPGIRKRLLLAFLIQMCAQATGNTSLAYYAPQIFKSVGASNSANLVTGFFGLAKVIGVSIFQGFVVERIGRRWPFIIGAFFMGTFFLITGLIVNAYPPHPTDPHPTRAGIAAILMVYLEAFSFNMSWGPLPWLYQGEIFPNRVREIGNMVGASSQWLWNFVFSQATPHALTSIGWRMFIMFACFNWAVAAFAFFFIRETKGVPLEQMEKIWGSTATRIDLERARAPSAADDVKDEVEPAPVQ